MSICDPALRTALRTLKLSGMLDTLDARLAQTRDGGLGHLGPQRIGQTRIKHVYR